MSISAKTREDPVRVAVIGSGSATQVQLPGYLAYSETNVVALCSQTLERAQRTADRFGVRAVYQDYRRMLDDARPNLVSVATPAPRDERSGGEEDDEW